MLVSLMNDLSRDLWLPNKESQANASPPHLLPCHCLDVRFTPMRNLLCRSHGRTILAPPYRATRNVPPFAFPVEDGTWSGISIELWRKIAAELQLTFEFREVSLEAMIDGLSEHKIDAAVAALTMTREREEQIDFTHPFYNSGLAIAARTTSSGWVQVLGRLVVPLGKVIAGLALLLLVVGLLVWLFERHRNPEQFGGGTLRGIGSSFWWSAVTMTTVGYGDIAPRTVGGRLLAIVWMFTGIIVISGFTAGITTALTLSQLVSEIDGP